MSPRKPDRRSSAHVDTRRIEGHAIAYEVVAQEHGVDKGDRTVEARCADAQDLGRLRYLAKGTRPLATRPAAIPASVGSAMRENTLLMSVETGTSGASDQARATATGAVAAKDNEGIDPLRAHLGDGTRRVRFTIARCSDRYGLYRHGQGRRLKASRRDTKGRLVDEQAPDTPRQHPQRCARPLRACCVNSAAPKPERHSRPASSWRQYRRSRGARATLVQKEASAAADLATSRRPPLSCAASEQQTGRTRGTGKWWKATEA